MSVYWQTVRSFNHSIRWFMLAWAFLAFAYFGVQGVLLNLYLVRLGYTPGFIGLLLGSGQLIWALFALPAATFGKRYGLRRAMIIGSGLSGVSMGLFLFGEFMPEAVRLFWIIATWLPVWLGIALITVNATPFLMSAANPAVRNHAFGVQQAVIGFFGFAGSLVAGFLPQLLAGWMALAIGSAASFRAALWLVPLMDVLAAFVFSRIQPQPSTTTIKTQINVAQAEAAQLEADEYPTSPANTKQNTENRVAKTPATPLGLFVLFGIVVFCTSIGEGAARTFFNVYLDTDLGVAPGQIGVIMGFGQLLPAGVALLAPLIIARWGTRRTIGSAAFGVACCLILLAIVPQWIVASFSFLGVLAMVSIGSPARNMFSQEIVLAKWRTTTSAIIIIGLALGWAFTAAAGGYVIAAYGFPALFLAGMIPSLAAMFLLLGLARLWPPLTPE
jgi:MFS family permease